MPETSTKHSAQINVPDATDANPLRAEDVAQWIAALPGHARLSAITRDIGSQRDPWIVTTGLYATWED